MSQENNRDMVYDFCVVGGGTVGIYLSGLLAERGHSVLLLEAGESMGHRQASILDANSVTADHAGSRRAWTTGLGGTSQLWGGQLWPWQPWELELDLEQGLKSWPFNYTELGPYYEKVLAALGLPGVHGEIHASGDLSGSRSRLDTSDLQMKFSTWMGWGKRNFGRNRILMQRMNRVNVETGILVDRIEDGSAEQVVLHAKDSGDAPRSFAAMRVVLAAGTFGSTRILAGSELSATLPALGTGFMDHVSKRAAALKVVDWRKFRRFASHRFQKGVLSSPRIVPTEAYVRERRKLPCYAHFEFELARDGFAHGLREYLRSKQQGSGGRGLISIISAGLRDLPILLEALGSSLPNRERPILRSTNAYLRVDVQQPVRAESRLTWLRDERSSVKLDVSWSAGEEEAAAASEFAATVMAELERVGIGAVALSECKDSEFVDIFHIMGGTPMGTSPLDGVVDSDQRVFGTKNIYVTGASVFPSGGMANPTFTALALTHRLAAHLGK